MKKINKQSCRIQIKEINAYALFHASRFASKNKVYYRL